MNEAEAMRRDYNRRVGEQARLLREAQGLSLRQLEARALERGIRGISFSLIGLLERGETDWGPSYLARMAVALGVSMRELTAGQYRQEHSPPILTQAS